MIRVSNGQLSSLSFFWRQSIPSFPPLLLPISIRHFHSLPFHSTTSIILTRACICLPNSLSLSLSLVFLIKSIFKQELHIGKKRDEYRRERNGSNKNKTDYTLDRKIAYWWTQYQKVHVVSWWLLRTHCQHFSLFKTFHKSSPFPPPPSPFLQSAAISPVPLSDSVHEDSQRSRTTKQQ